jgi:ferric-dicitrate binding protein FerR (iron transport regulator)
MGENIYRKLIIRELKGETSPEESNLIDQWINESSENQKSYNELWSAYQLTSPDVDPFIPDNEAAWLRIKEKVSLQGEKGSWVIQFSRIAAAAVLFFLTGLAVQYFRADTISSDFLKQYSTIIVPEGQKSMIVLPDGSNVWLNSGSSLKYKSDFNAQIREVEIDGEAFFEVKKDKSRMFRVNTGSVFVEVYGTAFDVRNYKEEKKLEVTVENGNVGVIRGGSRLADLTKGKQVSLTETDNQVLLSDANVEVVTAWKNNELIFDDSPFEEVIRYLERWYGVKITIEEKMKKKHNYTFKIKTETLTELLKLLKVITPLDYKIDGKDVTIRYAN